MGEMAHVRPPEGRAGEQAAHCPEEDINQLLELGRSKLVPHGHELVPRVLQTAGRDDARVVRSGWSSMHDPEVHGLYPRLELG